MKKTIITMALAIASSTAFAQKAKSADTLQVTTTPTHALSKLREENQGQHTFCPGCQED